jgi:transcriptional regulator with XRE-family HTH domain
MDPIRFGRSLQALRRRRGWRQQDVADRAAISRSVVSRIERGELRGISILSLDALTQAVGARLELRVNWRGEGLDRLLDARHAALVDLVVQRLGRYGWEVAVEASFSIYGERGSIDVLGWHREAGALLVVEVKSAIPDLQATLMALDRKARLAPAVARQRGWPQLPVSRVLVIEKTTTTRRRLAEHDAIFATVLPRRGQTVSSWLRRPFGTLARVLLVPNSLAARSGHRKGMPTRSPRPPPCSR